MTPFIPAFIYELNRGTETPTVDMLVGRNFVIPMTGDEDVAAASAGLPKRQRGLISALERPGDADAHATVGHWDADLVMCKRHGKTAAETICAVTEEAAPQSLKPGSFGQSS